MQPETVTKAFASLSDEFVRLKDKILLFGEKLRHLEMGTQSRMLKSFPPWKASLWAHRDIFRFSFRETKKVGFAHGIKNLRLGPIGIVWGTHR